MLENYVANYEKFAMKSSKKKCAFCPVRFNPHPRLNCRQKTCGSFECKQKQKRLSQKKWQKQGQRKNYRQAQKKWRGNNPDYWKTYRKKNPAYTKRNRIQSKIRWRLSKIMTLQKRIDILQITEKQMKYWKLPHFAKRPRSLTPLLWVYEKRHEHTSHPGQPQAQ